MRTLGIDLAAQPAHTAACVIDWPADDNAQVTVGLPATGCDDDRLLELMADADAVAIDAPFGWPEFINEHLADYAERGEWPLRPADEDETDWSLRLRYRETDRAVRRLLLERDPPVKLWPLSVSSNLIAVCAWRCASLLHRHAQRSGRAFDRTGRRSGVFEVYPAAALANWGLPFKGYKPGSAASEKSKRARLKREAIIDELAARTDPWFRPSQRDAVRQVVVDDDNRLDAFISAIVARAAATQRTVLPSTLAQERLATREGWIHVPQVDSLPPLHLR